MTAPDSHIYTGRIENFRNELDRTGRKLNGYSLARIFFFLSAIAAFVIWNQSQLLLAISISAGAFAMLLLFVRLGGPLESRRRILRELIRINEEEIRALGWDYTCFPSGRRYVDPEHPYASDLDIFGDHSLFQFLNRTTLTRGSDRLADWLKSSAPNKIILERQQAVEELSTRLDWRQDFLATGRLSEESPEDYEKLEQWLEEIPFIRESTACRFILVLLPALTLISTIMAFRWIPYNIPVFLILIQLGIVGINLRKINHNHNQLSRKYRLFSHFSSQIGLIEGSDFKSSYLRGLQQGLSSSGMRAGRQLNRLARLLIQFDRRLNMIMGFVLNALLMWDLQCVLRLENWKKRNAPFVSEWFRILGEFEALNSFANFRFNLPETTFPDPESGGSVVEAESLGHPLIPPGENIRNDLVLEKTGQFLLITGSNMAGKSTFLRTLGVNLVLAGAGAPVLAAGMRWQPHEILTNMRVKDSLSSRESTFYAELKRLRMIIESIREGTKAIVILDEILKGTNSRDKHFGSEMLIRQLLRDGSTGLIATHDLELSRLEEEYPDRLLNYCFEVEIDNQEFIFDYKLRKGVCKTLNATELMRKMGISLDVN